MANTAETCVIGQGIVINGRLTGDEDLIVEGRIEGTITLNNHLMVEKTGSLIADVHVVELTVRGEVRGNIHASELVSILTDATVIGDITSPRVIIEDGARFKGNIEMEVPLPAGAR
jgi:cytoskeletal protein CcmA (bactofilin family)